MDAGNIVRRLVHLSAPVFLVYYFAPSPLWPGGPSRETGLLLVLTAALIFELARLVIGFKVPGMRSYEAEQISAGAWAAIALTITFLFFPFEYAAPIVIGMALVDPLAGKVRKTKWYPYLPYLVHFTIVVTFLVTLVRADLYVVFVAAVTSALAIAAEALKTKYVDDDFLMIVIPLLGMTALLTV